MPPLANPAERDVSDKSDLTATGRTPRDDRHYFGASSTPEIAPDIFRGLTPRISINPTPPAAGVGQATANTLRNSLPILMTGSLAAGVAVTSSIPVYAEEAHGPSGNGSHRAKASFSDLISQAFVPLSHRVVTTVAPHIPDTYTVKRGDTLSTVAERFGIPTALLLTLNGLNWNSILHEGQIVKLTTAPGKEKGLAPARAGEQKHRVAEGDTLSAVAERYGISVSALAQANGLQASDQVFPGESLVIPGTRTDTAPRLADTSVGNVPRIVFASATQDSEADQAQEDAEQDTEGSEEVPAHQDGDPVGWQIAQAPELRPEKPAPAPAPAPAPVAPKPQPKVAEEKQPSTSESSSTQTAPKPVSGAITPLNDTRRANASIIVQVGRDLGIPDYGIVIALATAMQESSLRNIDWGDRDSVGLYQQRPSSGWGSVEQIMDPVFATKAFFGGPSNPNPGRTRGLLDYSGWESMSLTVAAQKVQRSAYPEAYAKWEASAWAWLEELS